MSVYLGTNCIDFLKINKNKEREKTVRFIDYDGTILHEYSKDEFLALSSMPPARSADSLRSSFSRVELVIIRCKNICSKVGLFKHWSNVYNIIW